jgi:membrane protease YdiL (CAAX protease family)
VTGLAIRRWPHPILGASSLTGDATYALLFKIGGLLIVPVLAFRRRGYALAALLGVTQRSSWRLLGWFSAGVALNLGHWRGIVSVASQMAPGPRALRIGLAIALPLLQAALPEEVVFRGLLQTRLEAVWGRLAAIACTLLLFTAWHVPTRYFLSTGVEGHAGDLGSVVLGTALPVAVLGLVFGLLWDRDRDLPALIALHFGVDLLPSLSSLLGMRF